MKKQIYKIGKRNEIVDSGPCGYKHIGKKGILKAINRTNKYKYQIILDYPEDDTSIYCWAITIKSITPKKVTKPSKKVKQEYYKIEFFKRENGWTLTAWGGVTQYLVFNTKSRLVKWIGEHI